MTTNLDKLIEQCTDHLLSQGYSKIYIQTITLSWEKVSAWFKEKEITEFNRKLGYEYCDTVLGTHLADMELTSAQQVRLRSVRMLISYQENGFFEPRSKNIERVFEGQTGSLFQSFLDDQKTKDFAESTIRNREKSLFAFYKYVTENRVDIGQIDTKIIENYFDDNHFSIPSRSHYAYDLRIFFKYLYNEKLISRDISLCIPKIKYNSKCKLPTVYSDEEIAKIINSVDRSTEIGKRDYLVLTLISSYGWRAGDVVNFRLSHIDWKNNTISFAQQKTREPLTVPLLPVVGNAIVDYLKNGRPESDEKDIIILSHKPGRIGDTLPNSSIRNITVRYINASGVNEGKVRKTGSHAFRHSLASRMLKDEQSIETISSALGHSSISITKRYLTIDLESLSKCVITMPEMKSPYFTNLEK